MRFVARLARIVLTLLRYGVDQVALSGFKHPWVLTLLRLTLMGRQFDEPRGVRLRLALEQLGPIFIKFGQVLSTRRDLIPPDIASELALLQDRVPPVPAAVARQLIEAGLGQPIEAVFASFEAEPVAQGWAGSGGEGAAPRHAGRHRR